MQKARLPVATFLSLVNGFCYSQTTKVQDAISIDSSDDENQQYAGSLRESDANR